MLGLVVLYTLSVLLYILTEGSNLTWLISLAASFLIITGPCFLEPVRNRHTSIFYFILPASTFEKFISVWCKYVILLPGIIFLVLTALNLITGLIPVEAVKEHAREMSLTDGLFKPGTISTLIFYQSIFMGGYYYFRKHAFAKTALLLICVFIAIGFFSMIYGLYALSGSGSNTFIFSSGTGFYEAGYGLGKMLGTDVSSDSVVGTTGLILHIVVPVGMWIVSFFKLKETEI
jgi:hypothetical protein